MRIILIIVLVLIIPNPAFGSFSFESDLSVHKHVFLGKDAKLSWNDVIRADRKHTGWLVDLGTRHIISPQNPEWMSFSYIGFGYTQIKKFNYDFMSTFGLGVAVNPTLQDRFAMLLYIAIRWHSSQWYGRHTADILMPNGFTGVSGHFWNQVGYLLHPAVEMGVEIELTTSMSVLQRYGIYTRWEFYKKLFFVTKGFYAPTYNDNGRFLALVGLSIEL